MEELDFQPLLDQFRDKAFQRGEQVILGHFGTVQTLLSLIFGKPVNVKLTGQREENGNIMRQVQLRCGEEVICWANTVISKELNRKDVLRDIITGSLGLGQIVFLRQIPTRRNLIEVGRDEGAFWRTYVIEGTRLHLKIHEYFHREPFEKVGWIHKKGSKTATHGSKMAVTDDEGETHDFSKFVAIGVQEDGGTFRAIEDELLTYQEGLGILLEGAEVLGEIASGLMSGQKSEEIEGGKRDGE